MDNSRKLDSFQDGEKEGCELASVSVRTSSASPEQVQSRNGTHEGRLSVAVGSPSHHGWLFWGSVSKLRIPSTNEESHTSSGHTENLRPTADSGRVTPGHAAQGSRHPRGALGTPPPRRRRQGIWGLLLSLWEAVLRPSHRPTNQQAMHGCPDSLALGDPPLPSIPLGFNAVLDLLKE